MNLDLSGYTFKDDLLPQLAHCLMHVLIADFTELSRSGEERLGSAISDDFYFSFVDLFLESVGINFILIALSSLISFSLETIPCLRERSIESAHNCSCSQILSLVHPVADDNMMPSRSGQEGLRSLLRLPSWCRLSIPLLKLRSACDEEAGSFLVCRVRACIRLHN